MLRSAQGLPTHLVWCLFPSTNWDISHLCFIHSIKFEITQSFSNCLILSKRTSKATYANCLDWFQHAGLHNTLKLPHAVALSNAFFCLYAHRPQSKKIIFTTEQEKNDRLYHIRVKERKVNLILPRKQVLNYRKNKCKMPVLPRDIPMFIIIMWCNNNKYSYIHSSHNCSTETFVFL